jgi:hypothetical protein
MERTLHCPRELLGPEEGREASEHRKWEDAEAQCQREREVEDDADGHVRVAERDAIEQAPQPPRAIRSTAIIGGEEHERG